MERLRDNEYCPKDSFGEYLMKHSHQVNHLQKPTTVAGLVGVWEHSPGDFNA